MDPKPRLSAEFKNIKDSYKLPYSSIGLLLIHFVQEYPKGNVSHYSWGVGTGSLLNSNIVLTCSHNLTKQVWEEDLEQAKKSLAGRPRIYADQIRFYRAWNLNRWPNAEDDYVPARNAIYSNEYYQGGENGLGQAAWDVGIVVLSRSVNVNVPFTMTVVKSDEDPEVKNKLLDLTGYPSYGNGRMLRARDEVNSIFVKDNTLVYTHETLEGDSGAPIYKYSKSEPSIKQYGIHVEGKLDEFENRRGTAITKAVYDWVRRVAFAPCPSFLCGY